MRTVYPIDSAELRTEMIDSIRAMPEEFVALFTRNTRKRIADRQDPQRLLDQTADTNYFDGANLTDDEGTVYETLNFNIQSVYAIDGDIWVSGNEFRVNHSAYANYLLEVLEEAVGPLEGGD